MPSADLRDYLALERTLLAWIRTGLSVMAFGFVVARLASPHRHSLWIGTVMIAAGAAANVTAAWRYTRTVAELRDGRFTGHGPSRQAVILAFVLALVGLATIVDLGLAAGR